MLGIPDVLTSGAHYPRAGIWGIAGTARELAIKSGAGRVFFVDPSHANANDNNDGLDPDYPKATLTSAVTSSLISSYDTVFVVSDLTESVVTPDYETGPNYINIVGVGPEAADEPCLDLRAVGWRIEGLRFYGPQEAAAVELRHTDSGENDIAIRTIIKDCLFDGLSEGLYGIGTHGCYDVWIVGCSFCYFHQDDSSGCAIQGLTTPLAIPYRNRIIGCQFYENDNHVYCGMNASIVQGNTFQAAGKEYSPTIILSTEDAVGDGNNNMVWGNFFPGDYSVAGGYVGGATDEWQGNFASDTDEAEVGDNGLTIAIPS